MNFTSLTSPPAPTPRQQLPLLLEDYGFTGLFPRPWPALQGGGSCLCRPRENPHFPVQGILLGSRGIQALHEEQILQRMALPLRQKLRLGSRGGNQVDLEVPPAWVGDGDANYDMLKVDHSLV